MPMSGLVFIRNSLVNFGDNTAADRLRVLAPILLVFATSAYALVAGRKLFRERPDAVWHARMYFSTAFALPIALSLAVGLTHTPELGGQIFGGSVGGWLAVAIWLRYFRRSRRALVTYGPAAFLSRPSNSLVLIVWASMLIVAVTPAVALRAFWPSLTGQWVSYAPTGGGFTIEMPGVPSITTDSIDSDVGPVLSTMALVESADGIAFSMTLTDYASDVEVKYPDEVLDRCVRTSSTVFAAPSKMRE